MTENADGLTVHLTLTAVPNSPRVPISISKTDSPSDLRRKTAEATKIPLETLRIIFRGRLIAEQSETNVVDEFKLEEGCVIHCMGKPVVGDSVMVASTAASADPSAMTRSGTPPGADPAPPALVDPLETSLMTIRNSYSVDVFLAATSMLEKILQNIVSHPMEEKYRKVKRENGAFQRRLGGLRGGHDAMLAVGFTVTDTDGEASYVMQASPEAWPKLVTAIAFTSQWTRNNQAATVASAPSAVASMPFMNPGNLTPAGIESAAQMLSDPQALQSILQNPMIQNMLQNDPRFANNPMLQNSMEQLANNPQMMSQLSQMMNDPTMRSRMQAMMGPTGGMTSGTGSLLPTQLSAQQGQQRQIRSNNHSNTPMSDQEMTEEEMLQEAIQRSLRES